MEGTTTMTNGLPRMLSVEARCRFVSKVGFFAISEEDKAQDQQGDRISVQSKLPADGRQMASQQLPHKPNLAFVILSGKLDARVSRILAAWPAHPKVGSGNEPDISCLSTTIIRLHPRCC